MAKILITGGTGFLGKHLLSQLLERGETDLRVMTTGSIAASLDQSIEVLKGSLTSREDADRAVEGIESIYHLAGKVSRNPDEKREMYAIHVDGTRILCEAAKKAGVRRIVLASTSGTIAITKTGK